MKLLAALLVVLAAAITNASSASETGVRLIALQGASGPFTETVVEPAEVHAPPGGTEPLREHFIVWQRYLPDAIYTTAGISNWFNFAGTWFMPPKQVEAIPSDGDGTPTWTYPGTELYSDASRDSDLLAALDATGADSTITVLAWQQDSSTPLWSHAIHPCRPLTADGWATGKGIQVSDDGSTVAVVANMYTPNGTKGRLLIFDRYSGIPNVTYDLDGTATALAVTPDGDFAAIYAWPSIYVYDHRANTLRWSGSAYSGNDAIAISADGRYIAWGWSNFYLREWNGSIYQALWQTSYGGTYYVTECAFSPDGANLAIAWYRGTTFDDNMVELYELPGHTLTWAYNYGANGIAQPPDQATADGRNPVEVISEMVFSQDSRFIAASSWGGTYPEIHLFERSAPLPLVVVDTPGTMFDIDVANRFGEGNWYITAAGKHTHAGQAGRGGDFYSIWFSPGVGVEGEAPSGGHSWSVAPNPFSDEMRIELSSPASAMVRWSIHDATGRRVAVPALDGAHLVWTGTDDSGRLLPAGTYFVRANAPGETWTRRIIRLP